MTLPAFLRICEEYGLKVKKDIFYQGMFGDYYACDYASRVQKAFMYTDAGVVGTTNEDKLREYLRDKMSIFEFIKNAYRFFRGFCRIMLNFS